MYLSSAAAAAADDFLAVLDFLGEGRADGCLGVAALDGVFLGVAFLLEADFAGVALLAEAGFFAIAA